MSLWRYVPSFKQYQGFLIGCVVAGWIALETLCIIGAIKEHDWSYVLIGGAFFIGPAMIVVMVLSLAKPDDKKGE